MDRVPLFLLAWSLGFLAAIPAEFQRARQAMGDRRTAVAPAAAGSLVVHALCGIIALFGAAPLLWTRWVMAWVGAVGMVALGTLAFLTLRQSLRSSGPGPARATARGARPAWEAGLSLTATIAPMILSWVLGIVLVGQVGLASPFTTGAKTVFFAGSVLGAATCLSSVGAVIRRAERSLPRRALRAVYPWMAVSALALAGVLALGAVRYLFAPA